MIMALNQMFLLAYYYSLTYFVPDWPVQFRWYTRMMWIRLYSRCAAARDAAGCRTRSHTRHRHVIVR